MANRGKEIDLRNFESNLTSTRWAKKMMINFSFLSNHCILVFLSSVFNKFFKTVSLVWFCLYMRFFSAK